MSSIRLLLRTARGVRCERPSPGSTRRILVNEAAVDVTLGHEEARRFIERHIGRFETPTTPPGSTPPVTSSD
jgi:phage baseplate assembly protein W